MIATDSLKSINTQCKGAKESESMQVEKREFFSSSSSLSLQQLIPVSVGASTFLFPQRGFLDNGDSLSDYFLIMTGLLSHTHTLSLPSVYLNALDFFSATASSLSPSLYLFLSLSLPSPFSL